MGFDGDFLIHFREGSLMGFDVYLMGFDGI